MMLDPDGAVDHVEVEIGDSVIMLFDAERGWSATPAYLRVYADDVVAADGRAERLYELVFTGLRAVG